MGALAHEGLRRRTARGAVVAGGGLLLSRGITFLTYLALARLVTPGDVGALAAATVVFGIGLVFAESGMLAALIYWPEEELPQMLSTAALSSVAGGLLLSGLALAAAPVVGWFFQSETVGSVAAAASLLMLLRSLQTVPEALLQRRFSFARRVVVDPLAALAFGAVAITCCAAGWGVWGLLAGMYARGVAEVVCSWAFVRWRPRVAEASFAAWRRLAGYARHVLVSEVLRRAAGQLDSALLGRFAGTGALGQYGYGFRIAIAAAEGASIASYVLLPAFARIADDLERLRRGFLDALAAMLAATLLVSLVLLTCGAQLAVLLFGHRWADAGTAMRALAGVPVGLVIGSVSSEIFKAVGQPRRLVHMHLLGAAAACAFLPPLLWALPDVTGVGLGVSLVWLTTGLFALEQARRLTRASLRVVVRTIWPLAAAAGAAVAAAIGVATLVADADLDAPAVQLVVRAGVTTTVFVIALRLLAPALFRRLAALARHLR